MRIHTHINTQTRKRTHIGHNNRHNPNYSDHKNVCFKLFHIIDRATAYEKCVAANMTKTILTLKGQNKMNYN